MLTSLCSRMVTLRAIGDPLLAFMLLSSGPLDDDHSLLKLDDWPVQVRSVMIVSVFCRLLTLRLNYRSGRYAGSSKCAVLCVRSNVHATRQMQDKPHDGRDQGKLTLSGGPSHHKLRWQERSHAYGTPCL